MYKNQTYLFSLTVWILLFSNSCQNQQSYETQWLGSTQQEIYNQIEDQFQGFSRTMVEVNYRYQELYWAGQDQNWQYADYQLEHILEAMEQGFVRRPERELSSQLFIEQAAPQLYEIINEGSHERFQNYFPQFTASCNNCHKMEGMDFINIKTPSQKNTTVHF
jgi:hypothetical protein